MSEKERIWVVDRIEGEAAVLVADDDQEILDMPLNVLPRGLRVGAVLWVTESNGHPLWVSAMLDEELRLNQLKPSTTEVRKALLFLLVICFDFRSSSVYF